MPLDVLGLDHLYITVSDLARSERFYDPVMEAFGFRKKARPIGGDPHVHYFNRVLQYTLRPARDASGAAADPYRVGSLHHLCFRVADKAAVDEAYRSLCALGVAATEPALYPEYRPDYRATFFEDPDGIRLEVVCDTDGRRLIRSRWEELTDFVDPVERLLERDADAPPPGRSLPLVRGNALVGDPPEHGERFDIVSRLGNTVVEHIVSSGSPDDRLQRQDHDEWVMLTSGEATLDIAGATVELHDGDYVLIRAKTDHRVIRTSSGSKWIAVHVLP